MRFKGLFLLLFLFLAACQKKKESSLQILGHAGMGLSSNAVACPGNSQTAIDLALSIQELDGMELDVRFSKDSTAWFMHDSKLSLHTNLSGCLEQKTDEELTKGKYKGGGSHSFVKLKKNQPIWLSGKRIFLDVKHYNECDALFTSPEVMEANFLDLDLKENEKVYLLFNNLKYVSFFHEKGWKVLYSSDQKETFDEVMSAYPNILGFLVRKDVFTQTELQTLQQKDKWVYLYDVRTTKDNQKIRRMSPTGILSDDVYGSIIELKP